MEDELNTINLKGGKLIGKGTYGCVFSPALQCKSKGTLNNKLKIKLKNKALVGKITSENDGRQEIKIANVLRQVPLSKNYFILPEPELCEPLPISDQSNTNLISGKCDPIEKETIEYEDVVQIFTPFGGKPLKTANFHPSHFDFTSFMKHLLEGGSLLAINGVCHFDIYSSNILIDIDGVPRFIDFGMSYLVNEISNTLLSNRWKVLSFGLEKDVADDVLNSEPPEITIMNAIRKKKYSLTDAIYYTILGKPVFRDSERILNCSRKEAQADLTEFWNTSKVSLNSDWTSFWKLYWTSFDSWSIGCILMNIFIIQSRFGVLKNQEQIYAVLRGLLEPSPRKRLDCVEALSLFDPGNSWLQRFGTSWLESRKAQKHK